MRFNRSGLWAGFLGLVMAASAAMGEQRMIDDFSGDASARWRFISDQVMGGVSTGQMLLAQQEGQTVLRLRGDVSTANNGGFVQARRQLDTPLPADAQGIELTLRGNGQTYYLHARTRGTLLPWHFFQAPLESTPGWQTLRVPFSAFQTRGGLLRRALAPESITSLAIVAYGRDHVADVSIKRLASY